MSELDFANLNQNNFEIYKNRFLEWQRNDLRGARERKMQLQRAVNAERNMELESFIGVEETISYALDNKVNPIWLYQRVEWATREVEGFVGTLGPLVESHDGYYRYGVNLVRKYSPSNPTRAAYIAADYVEVARKLASVDELADQDNQLEKISVFYAFFRDHAAGFADISHHYFWNNY